MRFSDNKKSSLFGDGFCHCAGDTQIVPDGCTPSLLKQSLFRQRRRGYEPQGRRRIFVLTRVRFKNNPPAIGRPGGRAVFVLIGVVLAPFIELSLAVELVVVLPIAVQEMVMAGWLIVKGFNPTAITADVGRS